MTDFKQKAVIFNSHCSKQCTPVISNSKIPSECPRKSNESLCSITFEINDIEISVWLEKKLMVSQFLKRVTSSY